MEKKYQVFISSTYTDLIEERKKVLDILLMADCIPAGMEAFVATDAEQFEVIKKVIDLCDYYVLILGRRYGSINADTGISYTEMEYDYAISKGIPVLVFALDSSIDVSPDKVDTDVHKLAKLDDFRSKAMNNRLASVWKSVEDLTGKLAISIMKAKTEISRPGWQRGTDYDEGTLRRQIMDLQETNQQLKNELESNKQLIEVLTDHGELAFDDCVVTVPYRYTKYDSRGSSSYIHNSIQSDLKSIFTIVATEMMDVSVIESVITKALEQHLPIPHRYPTIDDGQFIKRTLNQFRAAGLLFSSWSKESKKLYWGLTAKGRLVRDDIILIRKQETEDGNAEKNE